MQYYDDEHKNKIKLIEEVWQGLKALEKLAKEYGILDIFQDNGAKILQQLIYLGFNNLPGREGNDAIDKCGCEWEMKSINIETTARGFSTNHHTNRIIIDKYRKVCWSFAIYKGIELQRIYVVPQSNMEIIYKKWEEHLAITGKDHLNNPKIPISFVMANGIEIYPINEDKPIDPCSINKNYDEWLKNH